MSRKQSHIGGNEDPRHQLDHVSNHNLRHGNLTLSTIASGRRLDGDERFQTGGRIFSPHFLIQLQSHPNHHHQDHHAAGANIPRGKGNGRQDGEQHHHGIPHRAPQQQQGTGRR
jgi:hypothetical protein